MPKRPFTIKIGSQMGHVLGHKFPKGAVSITNYKERVRLRWRYQGKRYSLSLGPYDKVNIKAAKKTMLQIELDMVNEQFDASQGKSIAVSQLRPQKSLKMCLICGLKQQHLKIEIKIYYASLKNLL